MDLKMSSDGKESSGTGQQNTTACQAELVIAGATPFVTASLSTATEVFDSVGGTSGGTLSGGVYGITLDNANGLLTIGRSGIYDVELSIEDFVNSLAAGNVTFDVQKNSAALTGTDTMSMVRVAATTKQGLYIKRRLSLTKGDTLRARVTNSGAGGTVTVTGGVLIVTQVADSTANKTAPV
jgi:hypothetical protein